MIGELDLFLFNKGCHYNLYNILGAHVCKEGTRFAVWAPNAEGVSVIGDFNGWNGSQNAMQCIGTSGVWETLIPNIGVGEKYKYEIRTKEGYLRIKCDPFAFHAELRPKTASIVADVNSYEWKDAGYQRKTGPINIYEVHLGSWRNYNVEFPNYRQIAVDLAKYCQEMGYTHVELLPVMEHPLDESWGYQVTGFFAPTSRYGEVADFQFFVDHMHQMGIGVILDWVPAHFPVDDFSLSRFDGTALYEHEDPRKGMHPHWHTAIFNYGRIEVSNFLLASALFWLDKMHVDGLRVDAVASMVYLDYGRKEGEWIPNPDGSRYNTEAIEFLKHLNSVVHERFPYALMIAEESSSYTGVTHREGLQFDFKWNMGWMNDTLRYFSRDPIFRKFHQNDLTFSILYIFSEKFISVLSHDEVVHGKRSILSKMPGPDWQKFANVRLLYSYSLCHPGKKLSFMGLEVGQWDEWDCKSHVQWSLLQYPIHNALHLCMKDLNHLYLQEPSLWGDDFQWVDFSDSANSIISYLRGSLLCIHNFTPEYHPNYFLPLKTSSLIEIFNTDAFLYGGSNKCNERVEVQENGIMLSIAPLATMVFKTKYQVKR